MHRDQLEGDLGSEIAKIPLIDPHTHIDPLRPASRSLEDIPGYHYYTELAHSAGMDKSCLDPAIPPRERVRSVLAFMERFDNTVQYSWFLEIARTYLGFEGDRISAAQSDALFDSAQRVFGQADWEEQVLRQSNLEKVFLTNEFDDPLTGFDTNRYVPCLRTDALVFHLNRPDVRNRLSQATGTEITDAASVRKAIRILFEHFTRNGAKACAISLPPDFRPDKSADLYITKVLGEQYREGTIWENRWCHQILWILAENCREFGLPLDLMIGVNRQVYEGGVFQGQDLFDSRCSLIAYRELFNAFPEVTFCISVLTSYLNQELVSYSWIFPNVVTSGHWWYSNIPAYIDTDLRARLQAVPKTKQIGYYSDMYKLEFALPKYNMYRRSLARVLADDFVRPGRLSESGAVDLARLLLRDNVRRIFKV
jgi:glucuronate isomerase